MKQSRIEKLRFQLEDLRKERDAALAVIMRCKANGWAVPTDKVEICNRYDDRRKPLQHKLAELTQPRLAYA